MKRKVVCLLLLGLLLVGCGEKEPITIPKPSDMPDMEELVENLEPEKEKEKEEEVLSEGDAQVYLTRGAYVLSELDFTGDGNIDKIEVICYGESDDDAGYAKGWDIVVNDELAYDLYSSDYMQPEIAFYMLENKCIYLAIKEYAPGNSDLKAFKLYEYKNNKIKPICDFYEHVAGSVYEDNFYAEITHAKAYQIVLHCYGQFDAEEYPKWSVVYNYNEKWIAENTEALPIKNDSAK